jgi:hypothetical protein
MQQVVHSTFGYVQDDGRVRSVTLRMTVIVDGL